jgi:3-oxoacid CoA-transferase subunit B
MALTRDQIARRAAQELRDGYYVNLGIGMPTLVANFIPGRGRGRAAVRERAARHRPLPRCRQGRRRPHQRRQRDGDHAPGLGVLLERRLVRQIRGGHIDLAILGAMEVAEKGDLANWMIPGKMVKGMGGAMDLVARAKRVSSSWITRQNPAPPRS